MKFKRILIALHALLVGSLACSLQASQSNQSDLAGTITAQALTLQAANSTPADTPTATLTATPSVPQVTVSSTTNCRTGPAVFYDWLYTMNPGDVAEVVGKNTPTGYWIIKHPGGTCWLWGQYATVTGNTAALPEFAAPPTPTPSEPAAPKNFKGDASCHPGGGLLEVDVHISLTWTDVATNEDGYRIYRDGALLATLGANSTSFEEDTTHLVLLVLGKTPPPPWSVTYGVEAFNGAGKSNRKEVTLDCS